MRRKQKLKKAWRQRGVRMYSLLSWWSQKVSACSHYQLCPGILVEHLSSLLTSTLQDNIPFNCHYPATSYCVYVSWCYGFSCWLCPNIIWILWVITGSVLVQKVSGIMFHSCELMKIELFISFSISVIIFAHMTNGSWQNCYKSEHSIFWLSALLPFLVTQLYIGHISKDHFPFAAVSDLWTMCCRLWAGVTDEEE